MDIKLVRRKLDLSQAKFSAGVPLLLQRIYASRGVLHDDDLPLGLDRLIAPAFLKGLKSAVHLLVQALQDQKSVLVIGDFDADGATSSALMLLALRKLGFTQVDYLVPNRFEYGYGLTPEIVEVAKSRKPELLITVDNGISSIDGVAKAKQLGIQVLITDHHLPGRVLPDADAIVNPNQHDCEFSSKNLAGVGVVFYLLMALRTELRLIKWFEQRGIKEPNLAQYLDIVALGTVADVVPLDRNNRILVKQGLERIRAGKARPGILALIQVAKRKKEQLITADLGFALAPRLNAAGRLDDMSLGIECLLTDDNSLAYEMAVQLDELNVDRKAIEFSMQEQAVRELNKIQNMQEEDLPYGICLHDCGWHQGVIGILASRIKDRYHRPVIAFADAETGEVKGSARSITGFHIRDALDAIAAKNPGLIEKFGGHAMAAGLSLLKKNYQQFALEFDKEVRKHLNNSDFRGEVFTDGNLPREEISLSTAELLQKAGPWGQNFPEPLFDGVFDLIEQRIVAEKHLKVLLQYPHTSVQFDGIAFNIDRSIWPAQCSQVEVAYQPASNEFRGEVNLQLMIKYIKPL